MRVREIARQLGRSPSTVSRELRRNAATRGGRRALERSFSENATRSRGNADLDRGLYRYQHLLENAFARLKHYRAAFRYDKLKRNYESMVAMALWVSMAPHVNRQQALAKNAQAS
ncbi:hypothetical protein GCM10027514_45320 [Azotobacter armeniacus]